MRNIIVQPATQDHVGIIFRWRNDERTRKASRSDAPISYETHVDWFSRVLCSKDRILLLGYEEGQPIGVIRFDGRGKGRHEVSIFLDPDLQGRGYGTALLAAGETYLRKEVGPTRIIAEMLPSNDRSKRLFESASYFSTRDHFEKDLL